MELTARYIAKLGLTPSVRSRVLPEGIEANEPLIILRTIYERAEDGQPRKVVETTVGA